MGSKMALSFALLYVGYAEQKCIFDGIVNPFMSLISYWNRYIDIFFIWSSSLTQLGEFLDFFFLLFVIALVATLMF